MRHSLEETIKVNRLLEVYGRFLSKTQQEIMIDYFENNLSLAEISEIRKISRTAVSDAINKVSKKLEDYESKLKLIEILDSEKLKGSKENEIVSNIEERIKDGI